MKKAAARVGVFLTLLLWLVACAQSTPDAPPGATFRDATAALPTAAPKANPSPTSTRVIPATVLTPGPSPTVTPIPAIVRAFVIEVLAGDTITVVLDGDPPGRKYSVRYLGIKTLPASVPWGKVAYDANRQLTSGKIVRLEQDQTGQDSQGNLLRHVFVGDALVSLALVEQGLAQADPAEPDLRFQSQLAAAAAQAKTGKLGQWGPPPTATAKATLAVTATLTPIATAPAASPVEPATSASETPALEPTQEETTPTLLFTPTLPATPTLTLTTTLTPVPSPDNDALEGPS
jgi:endonuclease YncB( thermonuclease family)